MRELLGDERGGLRALAGLLFGVAMALVVFRRSSFEDPWGAGGLFVTFLIPCVVLYALGVLGGRLTDNGATSWQSVYAVFGIFLIPWTLFEFLNWIGGEGEDPYNIAWIFLLTGVAAFVATVVGQVRYGAFLGGVALIVAWVAFWDGILDDGVTADIGTLRGLFIILAALLLLVALVLSMRMGTPERAPGDVGTAAAIAAVAAVAVSLGALPDDIVFFFLGFADLNAGTSLFWDLYLLAVSLAAVIFGAVSGIRGPAYVGAIGLFVFVVVVGLDSGDDSPEGTLLGWPLILLAVALAAFAWSALPALRRRSS